MDHYLLCSASGKNQFIIVMYETLHAEWIDTALPGLKYGLILRVKNCNQTFCKTQKNGLLIEM